MQNEAQNKFCAVVVGATGLVGKQLVHFLLDDPQYSLVKLVVRTPTGLKHSKLQERLIDFEKLLEYADAFEADHLYCCLGTTIKKAGSKEAFEKVDCGYVKRIARLAIQKGVKNFSVVSASGADLKSPFFYSRVKAKMEAVVLDVPFASIQILRPSLLSGKRSEVRFAEQLGISFAQCIAPLMKGFFRRYRPVGADRVARKMIELAKLQQPGRQILESEGI